MTMQKAEKNERRKRQGNKTKKKKKLTTWIPKFLNDIPFGTLAGTNSQLASSSFSCPLLDKTLTSFPRRNIIFFVFLTDSFGRKVDVKSGGAAGLVGHFSTGLLELRWQPFDDTGGSEETWVTVFAEVFDVNRGCCGGFASSRPLGRR